MLSDAILFANEVPEPFDWNRLGEHLPFEWIEAALVEQGKASIRHRRLPAQQVVWLVIALALYRHHSIGEVLAELDLALPNVTAPFVTDGAVTRARQRLGAKPVEWLCQMSAKAWSSQDKEAYLFNGLVLLAIDGTTLRTQDSAANRAHFGAQAYAKGTVASYPQVRGATLTHVPTHLVVDARFGPYATSEKAFAMELIDSIADDSLTVVDKGFLSAELLCRITTRGRNRHFLVPAKSNTKWTVIEGGPDDAIVEMQVSAAARKKAPELSKTWRARAIAMIDSKGQKHFLLTSLTDRIAFKAAELIACYARRWHIETSYRELKQSMMGMALTLRSQTVDGVMQEIWGAIIAYNLIRLEIAKAALDAGCAPTDISFVRAFHTIQYELLWAAATRAQGKLPSLLQNMRQRLVTELTVKRPGRKHDRVVKSKSQRYPFRKTKKIA
ncbi:IS4 family transposase [Massilia cavernae]|uniref:IS4 family transposase n=1 Tax=Massilia cavernae TaxID=2320864 RepID=A0A418XSK8_9BURK|nr:IS4 family transposase [Massilia cavernae]RJG14854.1 IS4 family transposase [Massilia cavernae]RJG15489.1 IS4 family transposase [Massilia cavernae]RJG15619.1 IS4 family transposase [Massilia cavernae]